VGGTAVLAVVLVLAGALFVFLRQRKSNEQSKAGYPLAYYLKMHETGPGTEQIHELPPQLPELHSSTQGQTSKGAYVHKASNEPISELEAQNQW
jgi:hypothetical protein